MILHYGRNDSNGNSTSEDIADKILNLAASIKTSKNQIFVSGLVIRKDILNKKGNEVNELLKNKCDALRDLVSVTIWRLHDCSNACKCMLTLFSTSLSFLCV